MPRKKLLELELLNSLLTNLSVLVAEDLDIPTSEPQLLHLLIWDNQLLRYCTPNMEGFLATFQITLNASPLPHIAKVAHQAKSLKVKSALELAIPIVRLKDQWELASYLLRVLLCKPDVIVPVNAALMHPLLWIKINHGANKIGTQEAVGEFVYSRIFFNNILASSTKPRGILLIRRLQILFVKLSSVATWVYDYQTQITLVKRVIVFIFFWEANITCPNLFIFIFTHDNLFINSSKPLDLFFKLFRVGTFLKQVDLSFFHLLIFFSRFLKWTLSLLL